MTTTRILTILLALASIATSGLLAFAVVRLQQPAFHGGVTDLPAPQPLGSFAWRSQTGQQTTDDTLRGHVVVGYFFFTSCTGFCPMQTRTMKQVQAAIEDHPAAGNVRFVGFSVDPATDTPIAMAEYASRFELDPSQWRLLTGEPEPLARWLHATFPDAVTARIATGPDAPFSVGHRDRFVLIDAQGRLRGYYEPLLPEGFDNLIHDLRWLLSEHHGRGPAEPQAVTP